MIGPVVTLWGAVLTLFFWGLVWAFIGGISSLVQVRRSGVEAVQAL